MLTLGGRPLGRVPTVHACSATPPYFYGGAGRLLPPRAGFDAHDGECALYRARKRLIGRFLRMIRAV